MHTLRTRFKKEIVAEFLPPKRLWKLIPSKKSVVDEKAKVVILLTGMPGQPGKDVPIKYWASKGYWVFSPRYRGSWESGGEFLKTSPEQDVLDVIDQLPKKFKSIWDGTEFNLKIRKIILVGVSFGGPAALLASRDQRVDKVVALAPVIDWTVPSRIEPVEKMYPIYKDAFGEGYRFTKKNWLKLLNGKFYNPIFYVDEIDGSKIIIFHAQDDKAVSWKPAKKFSNMTGAKLFLYKRGGHLSTSDLMKPKFEKKVLKFISS